MKVSKQQAADNRDAIVQVAAAQIRERGFSQMSVAEVAKAAGLTHGALYSHFVSKEALQAAAIERAFKDCVAEFSGLTSEQFLGQYLSTQHRDNIGYGCPTAALISEVRWQSEEAQTAFYDGFTRFAALTGDSLGSGHSYGKQDLTMLAFAAMAGGLAISRAIRAVDEAASDAILSALAGQLREVMSRRTGQSEPKQRATAKKRPEDKSRSTKAKSAPGRQRSSTRLKPS
jgi:TetR/AcrR family transcriptional regulator, transcriptional repressor for nem operon